MNNKMSFIEAVKFGIGFGLGLMIVWGVVIAIVAFAVGLSSL